MPINPFKQHQRSKTAQAQKSTPYQRLYGLRENPFPAMALFAASANDPKRNGAIYDEEFRAEEERRFFRLFVQPSSGDAVLPIGFVRLDPQAGGRGNGKSSFLYHVMRRINDQSWKDWPSDPEDPNLIAIAAHVLPEPRKQKRFHEFIYLIFETLAQQGMFKRMDAAIRAVLLTTLLGPEQAAEMGERSAADTWEQLGSAARFAELLAEHDLDTEDVVGAARDQLQEISSLALDSPLLRAYLMQGADLQALWSRWRDYSAARWRDEGAEWLANGLVALMILAGYQRFFVLLDEFEKIYMYQISRHRDEFLDSLRQCFFERHSIAVERQFISAVLTIHPSIDPYLRENWRRVGLEGVAPLNPDQISRCSVSLRQSTLPKLNHLLITYLDWHRLDGSERFKGTLYPFAEGALDEAITAARFYPRNTLGLAQAILGHAAQIQHPPRISAAFVEEFLASGQAPGPDEDDEFLGSIDPYASSQEE